MERSSKKYFYVIAILLVALAGMYGWKTFTVQSVRTDQEVQRLKLVKVYQKAITEKTRYFLGLATTPFVWAIRKEMINENYEQINEYLIQFVKEPHVKRILVVKDDGTVAVATDKKLEGASFSSLYPSEFLEKNETVITDDKDGNIVIVAPIMGLNKKIGMFLMVYEPEKIAGDELKQEERH
jgi:putative NADH-flavin reductase